MVYYTLFKNKPFSVIPIDLSGFPILDYQSVFGAPLHHLMEPEAWKNINSIDIQSADTLIDVHLGEIKEYLDLLSKE
jgi:hypothetical protein